MENGSRRWLVDISKWCPSPRQFTYLVSLLPPSEHPAITRFIKIEDRKRALVSRLLQHSLVHEVLDIPFDEIRIHRTVEGKPYLNDVTGRSWRYSIIAKPGSGLEFIRNFKSYLTSLEWRNISNAGNLDEILADFCRYWCLKEAYVKALGAGVGYGLERIEIHHLSWNNISIYIDGVESREWKFWLFQLDDSHWASIVRGHPQRAVDSYQRTLQQIHFGEEEYCSGLSLPVPGFTFCSVEQLIPASKRDGYSLLCDGR